MFGGNIGGGELLLILLIALVLFGAKSLPKIARGLGKTMEEFRRAAREVNREIMTAETDETKPAEPPRIAGTFAKNKDDKDATGG